MNEPYVILFDGVCNLCTASVQFVIRHDQRKVFVFAALQSENGKRLLSDYHLPENDLLSIILIEDNKIYLRSTAALRIAKRLRGLWPLLYGFIIMPKLLRDGIYNYIAKKRYKWFGKQTVCMVPTPELRARFLN